MERETRRCVRFGMEWKSGGSGLNLARGGSRSEIPSLLPASVWNFATVLGLASGLPLKASHGIRRVCDERICGPLLRTLRFW